MRLALLGAKGYKRGRNRHSDLMLLSIVVINYNYQAFLRQAIDSALAQTYGNVEVVVVDDGSTDDSHDIIASYGDRVRPVFRPNGGVTAACNTGWRHARGDAVLLLDADDAVRPDMATRVVAAFEASDAVKVQFLLQSVDAAMNPVGGTFPTYGFSPDNIRRDIKQWGYYLTPPQSGNAYRKDFLDAVMPVLEEGPYPLPTDGYLAGLAGLTGRVATLDEPLGYYRMHGSNMSESGQIRTVAKIREMFMRDFVREEVQRQWADRFNWGPYRADLSRFHPTVCKQRLIAYRLEPVGHPVEVDGRWKLMLAGIWGALRFPYLTWHKRVLAALGFIGISIMPRAMVQHIAGAVLSPGQRPPLRTLLRRTLPRAPWRSA